MIDLDDPVLARCERCHRRARVPDPDRVPPCPGCGGVLRAEGESGTRHLAAAVTCAQCGLVHPHGGRRCEECGAPLELPPPVEHSAHEVQARHVAQRELRRGYGWLAGVTWLYRVAAAVYAVVTLFAIVALAQVEVPLGAGLVVAALTTLMTAVLLMGAMQLQFRPFQWTVAVAVLAVGMTVVHLVGPNPREIALPLSAGCTVAFLAALPFARGFQRLIAAHTDTYVLYHASRHTRRALEGRSNRERHARLLQAMRAAYQRAWRLSAAIAGAVVIASALGAWTVTARLRPQAFPAVIEDFEEAWNQRGLDAVTPFFAPEIRTQRSAWLAGVLGGHGLALPLPPLHGARTRATDAATWVDYDLGGIALKTRWTRSVDGWALADVALPEPPLDPALHDFLKAWRRSDAKAIGALFPVGYEERMQQYVERAERRRGWSRLPEIARTDVGGIHAGETEVTLFAERCEIAVKWALGSDGTWGLKALRITDL